MLSINWSAKIRIASWLAQAICGVTMKFGRSIPSSTLPFVGGSLVRTSKPAPPITPVFNASARACSSTRPQAGQCRAIATHGFTNAVAHEPCRFVTEVKGEMKLMSTDAVRRHHVEGHEPFIERDMSPLHDGAGGHGEILAAFLFSATIPAGLIGLVSVVDGAAMRAYWPFGPANLFQPFAG